MTLELTSPAFEFSADIPAAHTCDGADHSPPLTWQGAPEKTAAFALLCEDPDAAVGTWTHWVIWNIRADVDTLPQGMPIDIKLPGNICQGKNSWRSTGYRGPCPPSGQTHRYFFKLYALDAQLELAPGATKKALLKVMKGHVLAEAELMGRYTRKSE